MTPTIAPRVRTLVLLLLAVTGALFGTVGQASAHAALTGSDPRQGAVVDRAPAVVSLTFSEEVSVDGDAVRVLDPRGERVDDGAPARTGGTTYAVKLHTGLPDGTYTVTYQVVSADSHPVAGAYTFSIGAPSKTSVPAVAQQAGGGLVGWLYGLGRYVSYAGFIVLAGGAAFVLACWPRGAGVRAVQRLVVSGWVSLTASTLVLLLLRGSYTGSGKAGDIVDLELLGQVLQTKTGAALVSRLLLLAAAALFVAVLFGAYDKREDAEKRDLTFGLAVGGTVVAAGLAASWALAEHASTGLQPGIAMPVDIVHLLAVAAWLGGLTALLVALYRAPAETPVEASAVRRFSRLAFGSVIVLAVTGVYQSWRQLGSWSAFTDTRYGQLLLAKIGLVVVLVGIAAASRKWTARLAERVPSGAGEREREREREQGGEGEREGEAEREQEREYAGVRAAGEGERTSEDGPGTAADREASAAEGEASAAGSEPSATEGKASTAGSEPSATEGETSAAGSEPSATDPERAAQLARQRAARDAARQKRMRDADPHRFGLRRSVLAEAGVAVVLLAVTTALTQSEPGRTEQEAEAAVSSTSAVSPSGPLALDLPFDTGGENGRGVVRVQLDPGRPGGNNVHVYVERPDGGAFDVPEVKLAFTLESQDVGPLPVVPDHIATGHWTASGVQIPMAGDWKVAATVRTSDIDQVTVSKNTQIG